MLNRYYPFNGQGFMPCPFLFLLKTMVILLLLRQGGINREEAA